jgi:hypothetical protein
MFLPRCRGLRSLLADGLPDPVPVGKAQLLQRHDVKRIRRRRFQDVFDLALDGSVPLDQGMDIVG